MKQQIKKAKTTSKTVEKRARRRSRKHGVPPTRNLKKFPDEAYGDTEIPHRHEQA